MTSRSCVGAVVLILCAVAGCSNRGYPVTGTVSFKDGTPLDGGRVVFEAKGGSEGGSAVIEPDGTFAMGQEPSEPGLRAGKYTVFVIPPTPERIVDPVTGTHSEAGSTTAIHPKYLSSGSSDIEVEVNPGENDLEIKIDKPA